MHRTPRTDDVFDAVIHVTERLDPASADLIVNVQEVVAAVFAARDEPTLTRTWDFYVGVSTHDLLKRGITVRHYTYVQVAARTYAEAQDIAVAMAACGGWMPTKTVRI